MRVKAGEIILITAMMLTLTGYIWGGLSRDYAGTTTAQFLKLGAGGREGGMGEIGMGISRDANSVYWNPAGLNYVKWQSVSLMHLSWMEDINYEWAGYAIRVKDVGVFGLGVQYMGYGQIEETNEVGVRVGSFEPNDLCVTGSYAREINELKMGGSIKYISSKITRSAEAYAVDAGVMYELKGSNLVLGGKIENVGTGMKYIEEESQLPMSVKVGCGYGISKGWIAGLDIVFPNDNDVSLGVGTEYRKGMFFGRLGYNTRTKEIGGLSGLSVGAGIEYMGFRIDYAYEPYEYMGDAHRFSVIWNGLGGKKEKSEEGY